VFSSGFSEGNSTTPITREQAEDDTYMGRRRIVRIHEDYDVLYDILYYIYTGIICFQTDPQTIRIPSGNYCFLDGPTIYAAADRFLLTDLKQICLGFLDRSCDINNITSRVFSRTAMLYPEVDEIYSCYFKVNFKEVMETTEFKGFFDNLEKSEDSDMRAEINEKFRRLIQDQFKQTKRQRLQ
jgi:hypothetical protein